MRIAARRKTRRHPSRASRRAASKAASSSQIRQRLEPLGERAVGGEEEGLGLDPEAVAGDARLAVAGGAERQRLPHRVGQHPGRLPGAQHELAGQGGVLLSGVGAAANDDQRHLTLDEAAGLHVVHVVAGGPQPRPEAGLGLVTGQGRQPLPARLPHRPRRRGAGLVRVFVVAEHERQPVAVAQPPRLGVHGQPFGIARLRPVVGRERVVAAPPDVVRAVVAGAVGPDDDGLDPAGQVAGGRFGVGLELEADRAASRRRPGPGARRRASSPGPCPTPGSARATGRPARGPRAGRRPARAGATWPTRGARAAPARPHAAAPAATAWTRGRRRAARSGVRRRRTGAKVWRV